MSCLTVGNCFDEKGACLGLRGSWLGELLSLMFGETKLKDSLSLR